MTCVIGVITEDERVFLAGDSYCGGEDLSDLCASPKVYQMGPLGIGVAGSVRSEHILIRSIHNTLHNNPDLVVDESWLTYLFPETIRKDMYDSGACKDEEGVLSMPDSEYIIAFNKKLYHLDGDFSVCEYRRPYMSIGAGKQLAYGALSYAYKQGHLNSKVVEKTMLSILDCVSGWSSSVRPPFNTLEIL